MNKTFLKSVLNTEILTFKLFAGRLVEDMENKIRSTLNEIYFGKTRDIVNGLRSVQPLAEAKKTKDLQVRANYQLASLQKYFLLCTIRIKQTLDFT